MTPGVIAHLHPLRIIEYRVHLFTDGRRVHAFQRAIDLREWCLVLLTASDLTGLGLGLVARLGEADVSNDVRRCLMRHRLTGRRVDCRHPCVVVLIGRNVQSKTDLLPYKLLALTNPLLLAFAQGGCHLGPCRR